MADYVVGVSAGIAYGVSYVSRQPRRNLEVVTRYAPDPRYMGMRNLRDKHNRSYFKTLEEKAEEMAKQYDCSFVDNEMPYGRVPQGHPIIVDYFYHEEVRGTENTGKRNK